MTKRYLDSLSSDDSLTERQNAKKTERSHEENQERAYIAASRRSDRSLEARMQSARMASEIHKKRTGKGFKITEDIVVREEMYEEEDDLRRYSPFAPFPGAPLPGGSQSQISSSPGTYDLLNTDPSYHTAVVILSHQQEINRIFAEESPNFTQQHSQNYLYGHRSAPPGDTPQFSNSHSCYEPGQTTEQFSPDLALFSEFSSYPDNNASMPYHSFSFSSTTSSAFPTDDRASISPGASSSLPRPGTASFTSPVSSYGDDQDGDQVVKRRRVSISSVDPSLIMTSSPRFVDVSSVSGLGGELSGEENNESWNYNWM